MSAPHDYGRVLDIEASLTYLQERSERRAWHVAYAALAVAVLSAAALALMVPFYRVVPLPIEVDRLTGESQVIDVLDARHVRTKDIQDKHWVEAYVRTALACPAMAVRSARIRASGTPESTEEGLANRL